MIVFKVDESQVSSDGFMLNLTFVLQQLTLPIDIERVKIFSLCVSFLLILLFFKVDLNYPYYADDRISIPKDQSRLFSTKDDFKAYQENLRMCK